MEGYMVLPKGGGKAFWAGALAWLKLWKWHFVYKRSQEESPLNKIQISYHAYKALCDLAAAYFWFLLSFLFTLLQPY